MKPTIIRTVSLFVAFFLLTSLTSSTVLIVNPTNQQAFNDFFTKRSLVFSSIPELEIKYHTKFNFFQRFKINQAKKKIARELQSQNLLAPCDTIKLKTGEEIEAIVSEINVTEIKYKKCDNTTGPTYSMKRSDIYMIRYANGSKDFFGNEKPAGENRDVVVNSAVGAKTDPLAIASIAAVGLGIVLPFIAASPWLLLLIPVGIILGFVSKSRIKESHGKLKGKDLAIAAIVGGIIIVALAGIFAIMLASIQFG